MFWIPDYVSINSPLEDYKASFLRNCRSQQLLQRPKFLRVWSQHKRLGQSPCVHWKRLTVVPQLTHAGIIMKTPILGINA
jgi:hypothetical protein